MCAEVWSGQLLARSWAFLGLAVLRRRRGGMRRSRTASFAACARLHEFLVAWALGSQHWAFRAWISCRPLSLACDVSGLTLHFHFSEVRPGRHSGVVRTFSLYFLMLVRCRGVCCVGCLCQRVRSGLVPRGRLRGGPGTGAGGRKREPERWGVGGVWPHEKRRVQSFSKRERLDRPNGERPAAVSPCA